MSHLTVTSSHFTMKSTIYPDGDFGLFPGQGPSFTSSCLSTKTLHGVSRRTGNCSVAQRTPFSSRAVVNKPQTRHTDSALKILLLCSTYSVDKNSILISKAINLTLQIIKFRPQKQQKRLASFTPAKWHSGLCPCISGHTLIAGQNQKEISQTRADAFWTSPNTPWK